LEMIKIDRWLTVTISTEKENVYIMAFIVILNHCLEYLSVYVTFGNILCNSFNGW